MSLDSRGARGLVDYFVVCGLNPEVDFAAELQIESGGT